MKTKTRMGRPIRPPAVNIGDRFSRWDVVGPFERRGGYWLVRVKCDCGAIKVVRTSSLTCGDSMSCGCLAEENSRKAKKTHGRHGSSIYNTYRSMVVRCTKPWAQAWDYYGARGIGVCDRWLGKSGFRNFLEDMGERPSPKHQLDRVDNNQGYSPENCRWVLSKENMRNRRTTIMVSGFGETRPLPEWAERFGICYFKIRDRLRRGDTLEAAVEHVKARIARKNERLQAS